jgi:diguanylate cyclase (GGDEF)-like protein
MKLEGTFLRSRVARRILALFVLSAFLPALALAILSLSQVRALLTDQSATQLTAASKAYALSVYDRLVVAHDGLEQVAIGLREGAMPSDRLRRTLQQTYSSLTIVGPDARPVPILGHTHSWPQIGELALAHLASDESVLVVDRVAGGPAHILLLQMIDANRPERFALSAELNAEQLWGPPDSFSDAIGLCVLGETGAKLFCSQPAPESDPAVSPLAVSDPSRASRRGLSREAIIVGQWQLFLKPKFYAPYWTVIATEARSAVMAPVEAFSRIFVGVLVLALLLVAVLSIGQIRRTMGPLDKLINGTRRLAGADFGHRVAVTGSDEFGELATSFNEMAARLGRQLDTLNVLATIDQAILSKLDIDPVFNLVLARIRELTPAGLVEVVVLEPASAGEARIYALAAGSHGRPEMSRVCLPAQLLQKIAQHPDGVWLDTVEAMPLHQPSPLRTPGPRLFVLPIIEGATLCAFACLELADGASLADEVRLPLRDLCSRIGVALSAAARDERLIYQARHDNLTGLPNRLLFKERLAQEIANAHREGRRLALLYIDLDRFKSVNDSLGHTAGDELLAHTAERLHACIREGDALARLGGDEFAIILPNISGVPAVTTVVEHIVRAMSEPFVAGPQESYVSASIGIAICPNDGGDTEDLLKKADAAMYRAKDTGRSRYVFFEERMNAEAVDRLALERELRQALVRNEFVLHFQPQIDLRTGRVSGAEALLRWNHPVRGLVMPGEFIGLAEDTALIEQIGRRVLLDACAQHTAWRSAGVKVPRIAVNVSARQFRRGDLVQTVEEALRTASAPATALEIEVTESLFMDESADAAKVLGRLQQMGVQVAIDDFGTGYSSMSYLKRLPVDVLKVDQSFIADMTGDHEARAIAKAIINLAHTLNKAVIAEGVETAEQLVLLRRWRCNRVQGYYYSRPLPPDQFVQWLEQRELALSQPA